MKNLSLTAKQKTLITLKALNEISKSSYSDLTDVDNLKSWIALQKHNRKELQIEDSDLDQQIEAVQYLVDLLSSDDQVKENQVLWFVKTIPGNDDRSIVIRAFETKEEAEVYKKTAMAGYYNNCTYVTSSSENYEHWIKVIRNRK